MTIVELMIVTVFLSVLFVLFYQLVLRITQANEYAMAFSELSTYSQQACNDMKEDLTASRFLFQNDSFGNAYWDAIMFPTDAQPLNSCRLPTAEELGNFEPDTATHQKTGNCILFIKNETPFTTVCKYGPDDTDYKTVRIDVYRIVAYYLTKITGSDIGNKPDSLNLIRAETELYADYSQLIYIGENDPDDDHPDLQEELLAKLVEDADVNYAWKTSEEPDEAFFPIELTGSTYTLATSPQSPMVIQFDSWEEVVPNMKYKHMSVCWNIDDTFRLPIKVPTFGVASAAGDGFPHGFEVQIIGPSGARQIMTRIALVKETSSRRVAGIAAHVNTTVISAKDF